MRFVSRSDYQKFHINSPDPHRDYETRYVPSNDLNELLFIRKDEVSQRLNEKYKAELSTVTKKSKKVNNDKNQYIPRATSSLERKRGFLTYKHQDQNQCYEVIRQLQQDYGI
ncbi:Hypothetical_protein [Hexamita inflata]|uniref:Hypothetical_protein n=1 Tax=Hexamita inflata TaxID=28002 RepID=A0AA86QQ38_9EUKA|nr:Hypothetical protein HINF_LOCUS46012 [Hexamita inflata]